MQGQQANAAADCRLDQRGRRGHREEHGVQRARAEAFGGGLKRQDVRGDGVGDAERFEELPRNQLRLAPLRPERDMAPAQVGHLANARISADQQMHRRHVEHGHPTEPVEALGTGAKAAGKREIAHIGERHAAVG